MPTKWYWVIHGRLTSERKAYTSHCHSSITRPLPAARSSAQTPSSLSNSTWTLDRLRTRRRVGSTRRRGSHMHDHSQLAISAWYRVTSQASLSLSLPLTKVTHAQYRKRFRASYNNKRWRRIVDATRSAIVPETRVYVDQIYHRHCTSGHR